MSEPLYKYIGIAESFKSKIPTPVDNKPQVNIGFEIMNRNAGKVQRIAESKDNFSVKRAK